MGTAKVWRQGFSFENFHNGGWGRVKQILAIFSPFCAIFILKVGLFFLIFKFLGGYSPPSPLCPSLELSVIKLVVHYSLWLLFVSRMSLCQLRPRKSRNRCKKMSQSTQKWVGLFSSWAPIRIISSFSRLFVYITLFAVSLKAEKLCLLSAHSSEWEMHRVITNSHWGGCHPVHYYRQKIWPAVKRDTLRQRYRRHIKFFFSRRDKKRRRILRLEFTSFFLSRAQSSAKVSKLTLCDDGKERQTTITNETQSHVHLKEK